jgi:hypothetical protein
MISTHGIFLVLGMAILATQAQSQPGGTPPDLSVEPMVIFDTPEWAGEPRCEQGQELVPFLPLFITASSQGTDTQDCYNKVKFNWAFSVAYQSWLSGCQSAGDSTAIVGGNVFPHLFTVDDLGPPVQCSLSMEIYCCRILMD